MWCIARLRVILKMCYPSLLCKESINTALLSLMLVARSVLSVLVAITMGHATGAIVATDWKTFLRHLRKFALIGIPASLVNSGIKYMTSIISLRFQRRLTDQLNRSYVSPAPSLLCHKVGHQTKEMFRFAAGDWCKLLQGD